MSERELIVGARRGEGSALERLMRSRLLQIVANAANNVATTGWAGGVPVFRGCPPRTVRTLPGGINRMSTFIVGDVGGLAEAARRRAMGASRRWAANRRSDSFVRKEQV